MIKLELNRNEDTVKINAGGDIETIAGELTYGIKLVRDHVRQCAGKQALDEFDRITVRGILLALEVCDPDKQTPAEIAALKLVNKVIIK